MLSFKPFMLSLNYITFYRFAQRSDGYHFLLSRSFLMSLLHSDEIGAEAHILHTVSEVVE